MYTNSFDGETFYMEYAYGVIGGGPPTGPLDLLQQNLYALSFGLGASSLGNNYYATMDYYINGGYTRIRSGEIDVTSYKPVWSYPAILSAKGTNNSSPYISVFPTPNGNIINAAVIWLSASGSNTVVQVTTGEEKKVQPPSNLAVTYGSTSVGVFTDLTATLTWTASSSSRAVAYNIYRDSIFVTQVPSTTLSYVDHNRDHSESGTYGVATINNQFSQSSTATITYFVP
jgi:hypothetical protein